MALGTSLKENCCLLAVGCRQILVDLLEIRRFLGYEPGSAKKLSYYIQLFPAFGI